MTPRSQLQPGQGITPEPKLSEEAEFWECPCLRCNCLMFEDDDWSDFLSDVILFAFYSAEFCSFHPWPGHREARAERGEEGAVGSFYWSEVWLLLVLLLLLTQLSWVAGASFQLERTGWHSTLQWPRPGHRAHSHNIHSAVTHTGGIREQNI